MVDVGVPGQSDERVYVKQGHYGPSVFFEAATNHLRGDRRRSLGDAYHRQTAGDLDPGRGQATAGELGDNRTQGAVLPRGKLTSGSSHIVVDVQRGSHSD